MPEITITVNTSEGERRFGVLVDSIKDLTPVLKEFDKYKRAKIQELFDTQGHGKWPPRSERAEKAGQAKAAAATEQAPHALKRKLVRELRRAKRNADRGDKRAGILGSFTRSGRAGKAKRQNAVARRAFVLTAFEERMKSGAPLSDEDVKRAATTFEGDGRIGKSVRGLEARLQRAVSRAQKTGNVLGELSRTIRSQVKGGKLVIDSSWESPAVAALNDGATVGRGAKIPPRPFLEWEESDIEYLAILFKERAMLAWRS